RTREGDGFMAPQPTGWYGWCRSPPGPARGTPRVAAPAAVRWSPWRRAPRTGAAWGRAGDRPGHREQLGDLRRAGGRQPATGEPVVVGDLVGGRGQDDRLLAVGQLDLGEGQAGQRATELVDRHQPAADPPAPPGLAEHPSGEAPQDAVLVRGQVHGGEIDLRGGVRPRAHLLGELVDGAGPGLHAPQAQAGADEVVVDDP